VQAQSASVADVLILSLTALLLFAAGLLAVFLRAPVDFSLALRWAGVVLFLPIAIRRRSLLLWTFFAMLAGAELGADAPHLASQTRVFAEIFLRLIRMIVAPLIFGGIVTGIAGHDELRSVGRVAVKALIFFEAVTTIGLLLGLAAGNLTKAGAGVQLPRAGQFTALASTPAAPSVAQQENWQQILLNTFPENIAQAVAQNQILQVAVFALLFGIALALMPQPRRAPLVNVLQSLTEAMFQLTRIVMYIAPLAAGAALAYTVGSVGVAAALPLVKLVATCYAALAVFVLFVLAPILILARIPIGRFAAAVAEPAAIGFATTTSEAALPLAMERMEEFGVPRWIVSFVIPMGYSFNMTGSSIYISLATIFAARAAGVHLSLAQQLVMLATLLLTSKGVAGVSRAVFVILLATLTTFHIPTAAVMMILGVDTIMDMGRTALNVAGNCMAAAVIAQWEGVLETVSRGPQ